MLLAPFLPFSAEKLHEALGYEDHLFGNQYIEEVEAEGQRYPVLRYDAGPARGEWAFETLPAGRALSKPSPLFKKLDDSVIEEELARLGIQA